MSDYPTPITAAELWGELTDSERAGLKESYVLLGDELYDRDDLHSCDQCGADDLDFMTTEDERRLCEACYEGEDGSDYREAQSLYAWAQHVRGV